MSLETFYYIKNLYVRVRCSNCKKTTCGIKTKLKTHLVWGFET